MAKKVALTDRIKAALTKRGVTEFEKVSVYECVAASTRPVQQKWSIYDQSRMTPEFLKAMANYLEDESVPIQLMHNRWDLPSGQMLFAETYVNGFDTELNALFYVEAGGDHDSKLDLGIIDEVSIQAEPKHVSCSKCGYDYFKNDSSKAKLVWERMCDNEHKLGEDGCHLILDGVSKWWETSLVNKGASSKPKILPIDQQRLATDENYQRLAASGLNPEMLSLFASTQQQASNPQPSEETAKMDEKLLAQLGDLNLQLGSTRTTLTHKETELALAQQTIADLQAKLAQNTQAPTDRENELNAQLTATTTELNDVKTSKETLMAFVSKHYEKACVLLNADKKDNATIDEMMSVVQDARLALHQIPVNGSNAQTPEEPTESTTPKFASNAYCTD